MIPRDGRLPLPGRDVFNQVPSRRKAAFYWGIPLVLIPQLLRVLMGLVGGRLHSPWAADPRELLPDLEPGGCRMTSQGHRLPSRPLGLLLSREPLKRLRDGAGSVETLRQRDSSSINPRGSLMDFISPFCGHGRTSDLQHPG